MQTDPRRNFKVGSFENTGLIVAIATSMFMAGVVHAAIFNESARYALLRAVVGMVLSVPVVLILSVIIQALLDQKVKGFGFFKGGLVEYVALIAALIGLTFVGSCIALGGPNSPIVKGLFSYRAVLVGIVVVALTLLVSFAIIFARSFRDGTKNFD